MSVVSFKQGNKRVFFGFRFEPTAARPTTICESVVMYIVVKYLVFHPFHEAVGAQEMFVLFCVKTFHVKLMRRAPHHTANILHIIKR